MGNNNSIEYNDRNTIDESKDNNNNKNDNYPSSDEGNILERLEIENERPKNESNIELVKI